MKNKNGWSTSKSLILFAAALIAVLAFFSIYQYMRADSLSQSSDQAQSQLTDLSSQLQDIQKKVDSLQSQNAVLQDENKALQTPSPTAAATASATADSNKKVAYLTFDDGPTEYTSKVLDVLRQLNVKATFFITFQNKDTPEKRALLKQEADEGHTIGVHCWNHSYPVCYKSEQSFLDDFNQMKNVIEEVTGITPRVNRFPGGTDNTVSMTYSHEILMPTLEKDVTAMGYKTFDWNAGGEDANTSDPNRPTTSAAFLQVILRDAGDQANLVVLIHDKFDFSAATASALIKELKKRGYTFDVLTPASPTVIHPYAKPRSGLQDASADAGNDVTFD